MATKLLIGDLGSPADRIAHCSAILVITFNFLQKEQVHQNHYEQTAL